MKPGGSAYADARPRIHIWPGRDFKRPTYSFGPAAARSQEYPSIGIAVDAALGRLGGARPAVIIIEPSP